MDVLTPTEEQEVAVGLFLTGESLAIVAGAGTGKTSTLEMVARSTPRVGSYMAYNRAVVNEIGERFPMNVQARTAHSLAMRAVGGRFRDRLNGDRMPSWQTANHLGLRALMVRVGSRDKKLAGGFLAGLVTKALTAWCHSAEPEPSGSFIPFQHGLDEIGRSSNNVELRKFLDPYVKAAWEDVCAGDRGRLPVTHDHYFKAWTLGSPEIPGDFLLVDESQDLNPAMLVAVDHNARRGAQVVLVGDPAQQIYGWRGSVDAMAELDGYLECSLSKSWRFGPAIADVANMMLAELGSSLVLVGNPAVDSVVGAGVADAVLCRSNMAAMEVVLRYLGEGRKPHLVGGGEDVLRFAKGVADLQETGSSTHPDLACFDSYAELQTYVEEDPHGDDLELMVRMIEEYGLQIIIDALDGMVAERGADVIVSTAHRSKGREWGTVRVAGDFKEPDECRGDPTEERRLLYVAATRAKDVLDIRSCEPLVERFRGWR